MKTAARPSESESVASRAWAEAKGAGRGIGLGLAIGILGYYVLSAMPQTGSDVFSRTLTLHAVTLVLALLYAAYLIVRRRLPGGNALDWPLALVLGSYLLSTATSIDMRVSLEHTLFVLIPMLIFLAAAGVEFFSGKELQLALMLVGGVASLAALWVVGGDYFDWLSFARSIRGGLSAADLIPPDVPRVHGVSDHPNILGMTLVLILPFYVTAALRPGLTWERAGAVLGLVAAALAVFLTLSRGAWLGAAVGVGLTVVLVGIVRYQARGGTLRRIWSALRPHRTKLAAGALAVLAVVVVLALLAASRLESRPEWLFRSSLSPRYDTLEAGRDMFADYPVVGAGPGSYGLLYPVYSGDYPVFGFHAHNGYVQAAVELGLLGLAALAIGGGALAWVMWRGYRDGGLEEKLVAATCAGAVGGFLVHNIGDAANPWKAPLAVFAVVAAIAVRNRQEVSRDSGAVEARVTASSQRTGVMSALRHFPRIVLAMALVSMFLGWGWLDTAHGYYSQSLASARGGQLDEAVSEARRAADIDPTLAVYQLQLGVVEFLASGGGATPGLLEDSLRHLRRAGELDPRSALVQANLAEAAATLGQTEDAKTAALRARELAGADSTTLLVAGTVLESVGDTEEAVEAYGAAISSQVSLADSLFWTTSDFRRDHYADIVAASVLRYAPCKLGSLLAQSTAQQPQSPTTDLETLREDCTRAVSSDPGNLAKRVELAEILLELGSYDEAWHQLSFVVNRQPDLASARTALGEWYAAQGDMASARHEWLLAGQLLDPQALILLGDSYPVGEVPEGVVARLQQVAPIVAGGALRDEVANVYYRMKFGREPPPTTLIPGAWRTAVPGQYTAIRNALARWSASTRAPGS